MRSSKRGALLSCAAIVAGLSVGACSAENPRLASRSEGATLVCPTNVAIFPLPAGVSSCPAVAYWSSEPLFPGAATSELARFCSYTYAGPGTPDFDSLSYKLQVATGSQNIAEPDCPVVSAMGLADLSEVYGPMMDTVDAQTSRLKPLPFAKERVRVAVIDSAAHPFEHTGADDTFGHGRAVGRVIHHLACPPGGHCASEIRNYVGIPLLAPFTADYANGGFFGRRGQLARAIVSAVDEWVHDLSYKQGPPRLVINLSVGWTPEHGGLGTMPAPARVVLEAIQHANCYGALVVAAAGNHSGGGSSGPMLPGGWESLPAPTKCKDTPYSKLPSPYPRLPALGSYSPRVHAVGAVDAFDRPAANTRDDGQARLVAYGTNVVAPDVRAPGRTLILSGTSMSAAVASGAAAATWSYLPHWTSDRVMAHVYDKAITLTAGDPSGHRVPEFCLRDTGCSAFPVKRVSVCDAVVGAYYTAGGGGEVPKCNTVEAHAGSAPAVPADLASIFPMPWTGGGVLCDVGISAASCGTEGSTQLLTPWVEPQPDPGCDVCMMIDGSVYLDLSNPEYIETITLVSYDARFNVIKAERIQSPYGSEGYPEIFRMATEVPPDLATAELHFWVNDPERPYAVREPLQIR